MRVSVKIVGDKELIGRLGAYQVAAAAKIQRAVSVAAINVEMGAKMRCPVDTGRLRSSIGIRWSVDRMGASVGTNVVYAMAIEFGLPGGVMTPKSGRVMRWIGPDGNPVYARSVRMPPRPARPFLFPAWEAERPRFIAAVTEALNSAAK